MQAVFNYDILSNYTYQERFMYIPPHRFNRNSYICTPFYHETGEDYKLKNTDGKKPAEGANEGGKLDDQTLGIEKKKGKQGNITTEHDNYVTKLAANCQSDYVRYIIEIPYVN